MKEFYINVYVDKFGKFLHYGGRHSKRYTIDNLTNHKLAYRLHVRMKNNDLQERSS